MNRVLTLALTISAVTLIGCRSTPAEWGSSGGSKADGTVKMSVQTGMFQDANPDKAKVNAEAVKRCKNWGYTKAIPFDFVSSKCTYRTDYGCASTVKTQEYQCE